MNGSPWIATATQLPDDETAVLIALADGEVWTGYVMAGEWFYQSDDPIGVEVTHWMDFPAPPQGAHHVKAPNNRALAS
jgi:hypothetical protein